jgi:hypothetical protein
MWNADVLSSSQSAWLKGAGFMREVTESTSHASRSAQVALYGRTGFVVAAIAALFMTLTQGLGTDVVAFVPRLGYWLIVMLTGATIGWGMTAAVQNWGRLRAWPAIEALVVAILIAVPLTMAVIGAGIMMLGMQRPALSGILMNFGLVVIVSMAITGIVYAISERRNEAATIVPLGKNPEIVPDTRFRDRLPIQFQRSVILALESEDHYLRVHLDTGSTLILLRLSDAIAELSALDGQQTHRSWWVSRLAVSSAKRSGAKGVLILSNGIEVPISRTYIRILTQAGWLG